MKVYAVVKEYVSGKFTIVMVTLDKEEAERFSDEKCQIIETKLGELCNWDIN